MMRRRVESGGWSVEGEVTSFFGVLKTKTRKGLSKTFALLALVLASTLYPLPSTLYAAFEDKGTGARPTALGDTYVAGGGDVHSLMYNPAGLAFLHEKMVTSEYSKLYAGLSDGSNLSQYYLAYGQPIKWGGTLAGGWKQFSLDDLYVERTLSLGYGEWITDRVAVGGAVKQLYHSFGAPSIVVNNSGQIQSGTPQFFAQNGNSNTAYGADLGAVLRLDYRNTLGLSVMDVNEPNIALSPSDHEIVPRTVRLGLAHDHGRGLSLLGSLMTRESLANQRDTVVTGASEKWWNTNASDAVAVRGSLAVGNREYRSFAMGASYRFQKYQLDYAFTFNIGGIGLGDTAGTHRFSLSYRFGVKPPDTKVLTPAQTLTPEEIMTIETPTTGNVIVPPDVTAEELSIMLTRDTDNDGVVDDFDKCPDTPHGVVVDADGCPLDSDHDGVPDYRDQCAMTPKGTPVDSTGCALPTHVEIEFLPLEKGDLPTSVDIQFVPLTPQDFEGTPKP